MTAGFSEGGAVSYHPWRGGYSIFLPGLTILGLTIALLGLPSSFPQWGVRVYGGTTEGVDRLAWRLELSSLDNEPLLEVGSPKTLNLEVRREDGHQGYWTGQVDATGQVYSLIKWPGLPAQGALQVRISSPSQSHPLAEGLVQLSEQEWLSGLSRRGGWVTGRSRSSVRIRAAIDRGVLAVPFSSRLWLEVTQNQVGVSGAEVDLSLDGANITSEQLTTNSSGRAFTEITPFEHVVTLTAQARLPNGEVDSLSAQLPVVPGALSAVLEGGELTVESPIARRAAAVRVINERMTWLGLSLPLMPNVHGGASGRVPLSDLPEGDLWALVSSEPGLNSSGTVGWPIRWSSSDGPSRTLETRDRLLLDGVTAIERNRMIQLSKTRRWIVLGAVGSWGLVVLLFLRQIKRTPRNLETQSPGRGPTLVAISCVTLGFLALILLAWYRIR